MGSSVTWTSVRQLSVDTRVVVLVCGSILDHLSSQLTSRKSCALRAHGWDRLVLSSIFILWMHGYEPDVNYFATSPARPVAGRGG